MTGGSVRRFVRRLFKFAVGVILISTGCVMAFHGTVQVSSHGGPLHEDKGLQYGLGAGVFVIGLLFLISAIRDKKASSPGLRQSDRPTPDDKWLDNFRRQEQDRQHREAAQQKFDQQMREDFNRQRTREGF